MADRSVLTVLAGNVIQISRGFLEDLLGASATLFRCAKSLIRVTFHALSFARENFSRFHVFITKSEFFCAG